MCVDARAMHVQTKFLRLCEPVSLGDRIDNWRVSWLGGRDKCRVFFIVMVEKEHKQPAAPCNSSWRRQPEGHHKSHRLAGPLGSRSNISIRPAPARPAPAGGLFS